MANASSLCSAGGGKKPPQTRAIGAVLPHSCDLLRDHQEIWIEIPGTHGTLAFHSFHYNKPNSLEHFLCCVPVCGPSVPEQTSPPFCRTLTPNPPPLPAALIPGRLWIPLPERHKQSELLWAELPDVSVGSKRASGSRTQTQRVDERNPGGIDSITSIRDMGGKEKKVLVIANIPKYQGSDKKTDPVSVKNNGKLPPSAVPPPIPMSPIIEKMEGLKEIRNRSNSLRLGRLAFYRHLEKVETMRSFWELKHVELEQGKQQAKDEKDKAKVSLKGLKAQKKRKPPDTCDASAPNEPVLQEQVEKLNKQNSDQSQINAEADAQRGESAGSEARKQEPAELILNAPHSRAAQTPKRKEEETEEREEEEEGDIFEDSDEEEDEGENLSVGVEPVGNVEDEGKDAHKGQTEESSQSENVVTDVCLSQQDSSEEAGDVAASSKRRVTEEDAVKDDLKKSKVEDGQAEDGGECGGTQTTEDVNDGKEGESAAMEFSIDLSPPPVAPFEHRIVTPKPHQIATYYTINRDEVLGGGRFGQVHKCQENSSGLTLAAKIIKARSQKEKDVVRNEIQVMNQLNHANLIQLYAAFESRHDIILVMEYVEGGELFDRIIDENYNLTELDTVLFIRQICEGLQYMHKMYILHLDLKPENILCVSRATNKIKIIDFGLARRYKPREKLKVNFGTPEFLAPEVINYEFVSFPTDMWSLGVITYMLLSGLSPFLGDDDNETLNNILACQWNFEEEEFADVSDEAKDFISRLLVKSKSWRMSAAESLRHPWLSDPSLHYCLNQKRNKCHSTRAPPPESQTGES